MFIDHIVKELEKQFGPSCVLAVHSVMRYNTAGEQVLTILEKGSNVSPAISLYPHYQSYLRGAGFSEVCNDIRGEYERGRIGGKLKLDFFRSWEQVKERIVCRLIGTEKNRVLLEGAPHRDVMDLSVIYYYRFAERDSYGAGILIRNEHLGLWGVTPAQLDVQAAENTRRLCPPVLSSMRELLCEMTGEMQDSEDGEGEEEAIYVLSNISGTFGAYWMTDAGMLKGVGQKLGSDFLILPSSVHEVIILPERRGSDPDKLGWMVRRINETEVDAQEVLSGTVYRYRREEGLAVACSV